MSIGWRGVFPAVTTQIREDMSIDLADTQRVVDDLVNDGVTGVIALGTVGENNSLDYDEKVTVLTAIVEAVAGRVPVITGCSEYDTRRAVRYAQAAEKAGADGLMLLPPMVYVPKAHELVNHFKGVADQTGLPIMLYNNPRIPHGHRPVGSGSAGRREEHRRGQGIGPRHPPFHRFPQRVR